MALSYHTLLKFANNILISTKIFATVFFIFTVSLSVLACLLPSPIKSQQSTQV